MKWWEKIVIFIRKVLHMSGSDFTTKIQRLTILLKEDGRNPVSEDEIMYLSEEFQSWMGVFELAGLLYEFRFNMFFREVLALCSNGSIEELRALARDLYLKGKKPHDVSKEYKRIVLEKRQAKNASTSQGQQPKTQG